MAEWRSGPSGTRDSCLLTRSLAPEGHLEAPLSSSAPCRPGVGATETAGSSPAPTQAAPQGQGSRAQQPERRITKQCCSAELLAQDAEGKHSGQISFVSRSVSASLLSTRMSLFQEQERAGLFQGLDEAPRCRPHRGRGRRRSELSVSRARQAGGGGHQRSSIRNLFHCFLHSFHFLELFVT